MKKLVLILLTLLLLGSEWNLSDASSVKTTLPSTLYWYDTDSILIKDAKQLKSNSHSSVDELSHLIDGNTETVFHSIWSTTMADSNITDSIWAAELAANHPDEATGTGYHNLQVELKEPISIFLFKYIGRDNTLAYHDNPNDIIVYATNNDSLGQRVYASDSASWDKIIEIKENLEDINLLNYTSPFIDLQKGYKYIRFVIKNTTHAYKDVFRQFAKPQITGITWNVSEFQMYPAYIAVTAKDSLHAFIDSLKELPCCYTPGTNPGNCSQQDYDSYLSLFNQAKNALTQELTNQEYQVLTNELHTAYTNLKKSLIREIETGYYYIVNASNIFQSSQGMNKAMASNTKHQMVWKTYDEEDPYQLFKITSLGNNKFSIQNAVTQEYIYQADENNIVTTTTTAIIEQNIYPDELLNNLFFYIRNSTEDKNTYHSISSEEISNIEGLLSLENDSSNALNAWSLYRIKDQTRIDQLISRAPELILNEKMDTLIQKASSICDKVQKYQPLITNADQISTETESAGDGSAMAHLIDYDTNTIYCSTWTEEMKKVQTSGSGWHNLQFTLPYPINKMKFNYTGRNSDTFSDNPNHLTIYGTNDETIATSTQASDSIKWVELVDLKNGFPSNVSSAYYSSPIIDFKNSYKFLRFVIKHTTNQGKQSSRIFVSPSVTGVTFGLSELQIYDANNILPISQYFTVKGMKESCDSLQALINLEKQQMAQYTISQTDIDKPVGGIKSLLFDA